MAPAAEAREVEMKHPLAIIIHGSLALLFAVPTAARAQQAQAVDAERSLEAMIADFLENTLLKNRPHI